MRLSDFKCPIAGSIAWRRRSQRLLLRGQALELAAVDDLHAGVVGVHAAEPQVDHDLLELDRHVLQQVGRLLQLGAQDVAVVRVAGEGARAQHQAVLVRDHQAPLTPNS